MRDRTDLLTTREVAERFEVTVSTVTRWVEAGHLKPLLQTPGRRGAFLFTTDEVQFFSETRASGSESDEIQAKPPSERGQDPDVLTTGEVADWFEVTVPTVTRWVKAGHLKPWLQTSGLRGIYLFATDEVQLFSETHALTKKPGQVSRARIAEEAASWASSFPDGSGERRVLMEFSSWVRDMSSGQSRPPAERCQRSGRDQPATADLHGREIPTGDEPAGR